MRTIKVAFTATKKALNFDKDIVPLLLLQFFLSLILSWYSDDHFVVPKEDI